MVCRALILCAVTCEDFGDSKVDRRPSTECGNRFPPRSLGPSRLARRLYFARWPRSVRCTSLRPSRGDGGAEEIRRATRTGGGGGRVVPLPSSPKEGNAPCVPRVVLSLCLWREGATCSMLYFQFLFLCISVLNNLRSTFALAAQPLPIALAPLCHGHLIRDTQCRDERI